MKRFLTALVGMAAVVVGYFVILKWNADRIIPPRPAVVRATDHKDFVTAARPFLSRVAPGDSVEFAIHLASATTDGKGYTHLHASKYGDYNVQVDVQASVKTWSIRVEFGRQSRVFTGEEFLRTGDFRAGSWALVMSATSRLLVEGGSVRLDAFANSGTVTWPDGPSLNQRGELRVRLSGSLFFTTPQGKETVALDTGVLAARFDPGVQTTAESLEVAKKFISEQYSWPLGWQPQIVEDPEGYRMVQGYRTTPNGFWQEDIVSVFISPFGEVHRVTKSSRGTCVVEGTEISTPSGKRPVETLRVGDSVWSYDVWRERVVESKVQFRRVGLAHELIDVAPSLSVTPEHPVYTQRGYVPARDLRELDELLGRNRCRRQLSSVRKHRTQRPTRVFDLTTTGPHNFFAGGYLVHNKSRPWWPSVDDHWVVFFEAPPSKVETLFEATPQRSPEQKNVFPAPDPK